MANSKPIVDDVDTEVKTDTANVKVLESRAQATIVRKEQERKNLASFYLKEKKIPVTVSPFYAPYLGRVVPVLVNGIRVDIPADGRTYQINETHAGEVIAKIRKIDNLIARQKRASNVSDNFESNIGELQI
jgi:hypothetical protein